MEDTAIMTALWAAVISTTATAVVLVLALYLTERAARRRKGGK